MSRKKSGLILVVICVFPVAFFTLGYVPIFTSFAQNKTRVKPCNCDNRAYVKSSKLAGGIDWCSEESSLRGPQQRIVSYLLYGNLSDGLIKKRYLSLIKDTAQRIKDSYPGWVMRIYHNFTEGLVPAMLCDVYCENMHVDFCQVHKIHDAIFNYGNDTLKGTTDHFRGVHPTVWRFYPSFDPLVDMFVSRDLDSEILSREVSAVSQWLESNYSFHVMRDHPNHHLPIMAGMWGAKTRQLGKILSEVMLRVVRFAQKQEQGVEQDALEAYVWPVAKHDVMAHDSYNCRLWKLLKKSILATFPFPERRPPNNNFVGNVVTDKERLMRDMKPCPRACRPRNHTDWLYC